MHFEIIQPVCKCQDVNGKETKIQTHYKHIHLLENGTEVSKPSHREDISIHFNTLNNLTRCSHFNIDAIQSLPVIHDGQAVVQKSSKCNRRAPL